MFPIVVMVVNAGGSAIVGHVPANIGGSGAPMAPIGIGSPHFPVKTGAIIVSGEASIIVDVSGIDVVSGDPESTGFTVSDPQPARTKKASALICHRPSRASACSRRAPS